MRLTLLLLMGGILLLSACGEEESDPVFTFSRTITTEARLNGDAESVLGFEENLATRYELVAGDGRACAFLRVGGVSLEGYLSCWGRRIHPTDREQVGGNVSGVDKMLSIGADHVCTTTSDNGGRRVHCDGSNNFGENTDPEVLGSNDAKVGHWLQLPYVVASGRAHNCSLDAYGIYCWGDNSQGQTNVPILKDPRWVAAGGNTTCAIDDNESDELICWGSNDHGQTDIPDSLTAISKVAVGDGYVCVSNVGQVECWGDTADWDVPATSYTKVVHISAGKDHVCILDETQAVPQMLSAHCFGNNNLAGDLLAVPEPPLSVLNTKIRTISAGNGFTCASYTYDGYAFSQDDGSFAEEVHKGILCWGSNNENQASVPRKLCLGYHSLEIAVDKRTCPEI